MDFTFRVLDTKGSDEFISFIEKLDFVVPVKKKKIKANNKNIIPAQIPNGNPLMITDAFDHIDNVSDFRKSLWQRK